MKNENHIVEKTITSNSIRGERLRWQPFLTKRNFIVRMSAHATKVVVVGVEKEDATANTHVPVLVPFVQECLSVLASSNGQATTRLGLDRLKKVCV